MAHIPQNAEILKVLGSTHDALEEAKFDSKIDARGEKIINKAEDVLVDIGEFFAHKNTDNRLQEIFKESARIYKEISGNTEKWASMKKSLNDVDVEDLRTNLNKLQLNLRILALELIRSNAFREDIYDLFSLIIMLFENKAKEVKSGGAIPSTSSSSKSVTFEKKQAKVVKKKKKKPKSAIVQPVTSSSSSSSSSSASASAPGHPPLAKEKHPKKTVIKEAEPHHPKTKEGKKLEEKHAKEGMKEGEAHHNPKEGKHYEEKIHEHEAKHHHEAELQQQHPKKTVIKEGEPHHPKTKEGKKLEEKHAKEGIKKGEQQQQQHHHHHHQPGTTTTTTTTTTSSSKVKPDLVAAHPDVVDIPISSAATEKQLKDGPIIGNISLETGYPYYQQSTPFSIPISSPQEAKKKRELIKVSEVPIEVIEDEEYRKQQYHNYPERKYYSEENLPKEKKMKEETRSVKEDIPITQHKDKRFRKVTNKSHSRDEVVDQFNKVLRDISSKPRTKDALISLINIFGIIKEVLVATKSSTTDLSKSIYAHLKKILELTEELIYSVTDYHPNKFHGRIKKLYISVTKDEELTEFLKSLANFMKDSVNNPETIGTDESRKTLSDFYTQGRKMAKRKTNMHGLMVKVENEVILFFRHLQRDTLIADTRTDIQEFVSMLILDEHGRFSIRPEILRQLKMIIFVTLIQNLRYPLPEITVDKGNTFWMKMRGVVLSIHDILPDKLIASNEGDVIVNLKDFEKSAEIPKFDTARQNIRLKLENMNVKIPSADIEFERKKFPKLHDSGNATVTIGGNGMDIMLSIYVDTNLDSSKVFELDRVECIIHQLDIKLCDTKHDRMYNTGLKMLKPVLKKNIQNTIQDNIIKVLTKVNNLIVKQKSLLRESTKLGAEKLKRGKEKSL